MPPTNSILGRHLEHWALKLVNSRISSLNLSSVAKLVKFEKRSYVYEHQGLSHVAQFRLGCAGLGNKAPRQGRQRTFTCSLCREPLSECHVAFLCPAMEDFRHNNTDITTFISMCQSRSIHPRIAYKWYVMGLDWKDENIPTLAYLQRGQTLQKLLSEWLRRT